MKITALRGDGVTLTAASAECLSTARVANPDTHRAYASAIDRIIAQFGGGVNRPQPPHPNARPRHIQRFLAEAGTPPHSSHGIDDSDV
ncbi:hypothetical protein ACQPYK_29500 [Streptosporangium sp. CA-135522]|uniref:hypothetical protein n=1 Tax=Streptosporangium sp. CA-135522 TaxID=3240072 RepID=UPI003D911479